VFAVSSSKEIVNSILRDTDLDDEISFEEFVLAMKYHVKDTIPKFLT